ncbi:MAG: CxxxxCH/CxxCH domain c-type cytochrome [Deltaproteobacteria bacterium]
MTGTQPGRPWILALLFAALIAAGCSSGTSTGSLVDASGSHPANFIDTHRALALPDGSACTSCHGDDLRGGIANVSCFSASRNGVACHANGPAFHPANWVDIKTRGTSSWHGDAFLSGTLINGLQCSSCHTLGTSGTPGTGKCVTCHFTFTSAPVRRIPVGDATLHDWTSFQTAGHGAPAFFNDNVVNGVCQECHNANIRFANPPQQCHNCHEPFPSFHPAGWSDPADHGAAAKDAPSANRGFAFCRTCHGTGFAGSGNAPSCINNSACHGTSGNPATPAALNQAPHAKRQWRTSAGTTLTHTSTASDNSNATVCYTCHSDRANTIDVPAPTPAFDPASPPGCFNSSLCHGEAVAHPTGASWLPGSLHGATAKADLTYCQSCHADAPAPATNPRFNVVLVSPPGPNNSSCENCHKTGTAHPPVDPAKATGDPRWYLHRLSGNKHVACPQCHGPTLQGPAEGGVGPRCQDCHRLGPPIVFPSTAVQPATCTTCHTFPPNGTPNQFPNIAGTHGIHNSFAGVHNECDSCHNGAGFGSGANHFMDNTVNVSFLAAFNAESGTAGYNAAAFTCSNVSCHGGQTTPNWRTGTIDVNADAGCRGCHALGTAQFNSYNSGEHNNSNHRNRACTVCHNTTTLAVNHFTTLGTTAMEGPASATVGGGTTTVVTYVPATRDCTPRSGSGCHGTERW